MPPLEGCAGSHRRRRGERQPRLLRRPHLHDRHRAGQTFKPGIDFYSDTSGRKGQAAALQTYAGSHNVRAVVVMIGANNYGFAAILERCVTNWITSPSWFKNYCSDDSDMTSRFTATRKATETANVRDALLRVRHAMSNAGYRRRSEGRHPLLPAARSTPSVTLNSVASARSWPTHSKSARWLPSRAMPSFSFRSARPSPRPRPSVPTFSTKPAVFFG